MTNLEIIKSLDEFQMGLFLRDFYLVAYYKTPGTIREWLNSKVDKDYWFNRMEILHLDGNKYD